MQLLYFFESIRNPVCDFLFSVITFLGGETLFLVLAIAVFWCVDKREGYYIFFTGLFGTLLNQALKLIFKIPRPWVKDPNFTIVESARAEATGYSFPSGHTQNATGTFGAMAAYDYTRRRRLRPVFLLSALILLVAVSRMYLGVHTPLDVSVSFVIALVLVFFLRPFFTDEAKYRAAMPYFALAGWIFSGALVLYTHLLPDGAADAANLASARSNSLALHGAAIGIAFTWILDSRRLNFSVGGRWYARVVELLVGLAAVLLLKAGLKVPLEFLCFGNVGVARVVRYFLVVAFAGVVYPLTFSHFAKWTCAPLDRFGMRVASLFCGKRKAEGVCPPDGQDGKNL